MVEEMGIPAASTVVELGPGSGSFTVAIEREIAPHASCFAVELNPALANGLRSRVRRAVVIEGSAEHLHTHLDQHGCAHADAILCGLPWASFHPSLQERLMTSIEASLRPGGRFATFQYIHASWFPTARRFRKLLERHFSSVETSNVEWRNVPPAFVFRCTKRRPGARQERTAEENETRGQRPRAADGVGASASSPA